MDDPVTGSISEQLEEQVAEVLDEQRPVGVSIGVVRDQELVWTGGFGYADLESERKPDEHTLYRVASITKTFTGTAIFQLRDCGRLSLDDPVVKHIGEFADVEARAGNIEAVTLRRLMCHHSGLMAEAPGDQWETLEFPGIEEILKVLPDVEVVIDPDLAFKYSNLAFALLGEVVSRVSGQSYTEYVLTNILDPLGMRTSSFELTDALRPRVATGYQILSHETSTSIAPHPHLNGYVAAGGLYSCVADLARWIAFQFRTDVSERADAQVLAGSSLKEMQRPQFVDSGWDTGYCLPWWGQRIGKDIFLGHGGGLQGFLSQIFFSPERRLGLVALTNSDGHSARYPLLARIIETITGAETEGPEETTVTSPVSTPKAWQAFVGSYVSTTLGNQTSVETCEGELLLVSPPADGRQPPPVRLEPTEDPDAFLATSGRGAGERVEFRRDSDGTVTGYMTTGFPWIKL